MNDIIERLRAQFEAREYNIFGEAADEIEKLRREVAALKADAERYRWLLRDADHATSLVDDTYSDWDIDQDWREMLNAAIDEKRGQEP